MRLIALTVTKTYTVLVSAPSALTVSEVLRAAQKDATGCVRAYFEEVPLTSVTAEPSTLEGLHTKPDLTISADNMFLNQEAELVWVDDGFSVPLTDQTFEDMTGRAPPSAPDQTDLFAEKKP